MKQAVFATVIALLSAILAIAGYRYVDSRAGNDVSGSFFSGAIPAKATVNSSAGNPDFVQAAASVTPAVVHVKTTYGGTAPASRNPIFELFGLPQEYRPARGAGSGVLISPDGFIVTNNHVIENTTGIEVVLPDKRSYEARLIGRDPSTDLALLKVEGSQLPIVPLGDSDSVQVGEWVLAVGYPLSLNSTVTAGIVSAKGRSIGILNRPGQGGYADPAQVANTAIESFIQTDAAINPGNSGGALVNTSGHLIGINTAIASQTGSYAGYGFAIPVNLMQKVVSDIRKYGEVKRGYLGVTFPVPAVEDQIMRSRGIDPAEVQGVYIMGVQPESGAAAAGLQEGDIIQGIDGVGVGSSAELSERIARHYPGDKVELTYLRNGKQRRVRVELKGSTGESESEIAGKELEVRLGASFAPLPDRLKKRYDLSGGVQVATVRPGGFFDSAGIPEGTVITRVNGRLVNNLADISKALAASRSGMVRLDGITPDGTAFVFNFPLGA
ncbi:trypsin-like peptidase domain-containing protein [Pontibacter sp. JH31]|uniref:Trypsin-like peptidase domain-containing protein n=1 Tax=Pontibacter aquaedesilientis TaxID=2766980 RepID=A0ABR7XIA5_9BACT|nr:trypsin-like peptidase domain-containing protein [Pontibacter aquaedesilientis]MBD1397696.1 trypsin-like peptidase domain-containing protein [Pontibacter aquaedesilientis]